MRELDPKAATDGRGTFHFQCLFLHLLKLLVSALLYTFLKLIALNAKYTLKNPTIYPFCKSKENQPNFHKAQLKVIFILFIFHSNFHFLDLRFSNTLCCKLRACITKFGADCICHRILSHAVMISVLG